MKKTILIIAISIITLKTFAQNAIFIGPTFHWNLSNSQFSWGVEASYWNFNNSMFNFSNLNGFDIGFEKSERKFRIYSEYQLGLKGILGLSAGIIEEFSRFEKPKTGIQGSIWGSIFLGGDLRYRYFIDDHYFNPGLFLKIPIKLNLEKSHFSSLRFM